MERTESVANDAVGQLLTCLGSSQPELAEAATARDKDASILGSWELVEDEQGAYPPENSPVEESLGLTVWTDRLQVILLCNVREGVEGEHCTFNKTESRADITVDEKAITDFVVTSGEYYVSEDGELELREKAEGDELKMLNDYIERDLPIYYTAGEQYMTWQLDLPQNGEGQPTDQGEQSRYMRFRRLDP